MLALIQQYRLLLSGLAMATLMALSAYGAWSWQANAYTAQIAIMQADQAQALATAQAQARSEEQRRQTALEIIRNESHQSTEQALADAAAADATAGGLLLELDRLKRRAAICTSATVGGTPAKDAATVLADLLSEVESAGRAMAAEADRRGIAGSACERSYDAVKGGG
jgi:hypothetical protein